MTEGNRFKVNEYKIVLQEINQQITNTIEFALTPNQRQAFKSDHTVPEPNREGEEIINKVSLLTETLLKLTEEQRALEQQYRKIQKTHEKLRAKYYECQEDNTILEDNLKKAEDARSNDEKNLKQKHRQLNNAKLLYD